MLEIIECRHLSEQQTNSLTVFFEQIAHSSEFSHFHPHPFTQGEVKKKVQSTARDLFYVLCNHADILAYGMLRGWDEGFAIPTLGIAVHPDYQGLGYGEMFVHFLHGAAKNAGATQCMLKVYKENKKACLLYEKMGYVFLEPTDGQRVGYKRLT